MRLNDEEAVMKKMGLDFEMLNSGCCGMAGSFGFEADKYDVSIKCGERVLFPAVRKAGLSTWSMADGFSCKEQIQQDTNRHALHLAEVMALALRKGAAWPHGMYPEKSMIEPRLRPKSVRPLEPECSRSLRVRPSIAGLWFGSKLIRR